MGDPYVCFVNDFQKYETTSRAHHRVESPNVKCKQGTSTCVVENGSSVQGSSTQKEHKTLACGPMRPLQKVTVD